MLAVVGGLVVSFFLFGFWWPYWRMADMDLWMTYEGLLFNGALPQEYFDHPGYLTILLLGNWFGLLHGLGILKVHALSLLPHPAESGDAWTHAVRAGRVLSLILACILVFTFGALLRRLTGNWRIAALGAFALAFSGGFIVQARVMRTELISAGCFACALLTILIAARTPSTAWRPALVGLSALLATLAMINKVQVVFLVCAIPLLVLPFGVTPSGPGGPWMQPRRAIPATALYLAVAALLAVPAWPLVWLGLSQASASLTPWRPFAFSAFGVYQAIIAASIALAMCAFASQWRVTALETVAAMAAVIAGFALGLLTLNIRYNPQNVLVVMNPLEQLFYWATMSDNDLGRDGTVASSHFLYSLLAGIGEVIARRTYILHPSARPTIFLEWLVMVGAFVAWKAGQRKLVLQIAVLMLVVWGFDAIGTFRGLKIEYFTYTDPLVIIAAALLLADFPQLQAHRWAYQVGTSLIAVHFLVGLAEPVKNTFRRSLPLYLCGDHFHYTKRVERFSYCPPPAT